MAAEAVVEIPRQPVRPVDRLAGELRQRPVGVGLPQRLHRLIVAVATGAEARVMPIGQHTRRARRRQIGAFHLPGDVYFIETLPVRPEAGDFAAVILAAIALCLAAAWYPAWQASRLDPVAAIRRQT